MSDNLEQRSDSLDKAFKKPEAPKSAEDRSKDLIANFERSFDDLSKPETREFAESQEKQELPSDQTEKSVDRLTPTPDKAALNSPEKDRPQGLTSGQAMKNIVDELGLANDKTSRLVTQVLEGNITSVDRQRLAKRGPEGQAAVQIAAQIERVLGQINGNAKQILKNAQNIIRGEMVNSASVIENYSRQVAQQLQKGSATQDALAYVIVDQMAVTLVEGLRDSGVKIG